MNYLVIHWALPMIVGLIELMQGTKSGLNLMHLLSVTPVLHVFTLYFYHQDRKALFSQT